MLIGTDSRQVDPAVSDSDDEELGVVCFRSKGWLSFSSASSLTLRFVALIVIFEHLYTNRLSCPCCPRRRHTSAKSPILLHSFRPSFFARSNPSVNNIQVLNSLRLLLHQAAERKPKQKTHLPHPADISALAPLAESANFFVLSSSPTSLHSPRHRGPPPLCANVLPPPLRSTRASPTSLDQIRPRLLVHSPRGQRVES